MRTIRTTLVGSLIFVVGCSTGPTPAAKSPSSPGAGSSSLQLEFTSSASGNAQATPVLGALEQELRRSMDEMRKRGDPPPYYMAYEVADKQEVRIEASFGALVRSDEGRARVLDVDVRVGSPELDNTHPVRGDAFATFSRRFGMPTPLPLENDAAALRAAIWLKTDQRYKEAVADLVKVKGNKAVRVKEEDASADFSLEQPSQYLEPLATLEVDRATWEKRVREYASVFRRYPDIYESDISFQAGIVNRYLINSEGSRLQTARTHVRLFFRASTKADDGMELDRYDSIDVSSVDRLPSDEEIRRRLQAVIDDLLALRKAPVAEPFVGPAILEGRAAGVYFHEIFGHRVEGHRQKDEEEGQTFAKKIGERIMPDFMRVYDDPTIRALNGIDLNGHYRFDDEGVPARRATLVEDGTLKGFLMSRSPTRGFNRSNGHGRRQEGHDVVARQANLIVDPVRTMPAAELKQLLIAEVKRQGKPYGLRFRLVEGGFTMTQRFGPQAFKVLPIVVYRVYPDGREELVRGADLEGTPLTSLSKILAAGDDYAVFNGYCGAESGMVPVAAASPSLLVGQVEIARKEKGQDKPPILPPPALGRESVQKGGAR